MTTENGSPSSAGPSPSAPVVKRKFLSLPFSRLGWAAVILFAVFVLLMGLNSLMIAGVSPFLVLPIPLAIAYGFIELASGLAAGILAVVALVKKGERSWLVWFSLYPAVFVLTLLAGEIIFPH